MSDYELTPLGAAIVEALSDRKLKAAIERAFKRSVCPVSAIFSAAEVEAWYRTRGQDITAVTFTARDQLGMLQQAVKDKEATP